MRKRKVIILAALAFAAALLLLLQKNQKEPTYNGRSLSYWLNTFGVQWYNAYFSGAVGPEFAEATNALSHIGTNALPSVLKWMHYEPPAWRRKLMRQARQLPGLYVGGDKLSYFIEGSTARKAYYAGSSFHVFGTNALVALPELVTMMRDTNAPNTASRAIFALTAMGPDAFPILTNALTNRSQSNREYLVWSIYASMPKVIGTNACLPPLITALVDSNPLVRDAATGALTRLAPQAITNAGFLIAPEPAVTNGFSN